MSRRKAHEVLAFPIAVALLETEVARLTVDHYDDDRYAKCMNCRLAAQAHVELVTLRLQLMGDDERGKS